MAGAGRGGIGGLLRPTSSSASTSSSGNPYNQSGAGGGLGVTLYHPHAGNLALPWPAHDAPVEYLGNQYVGYTAGGNKVVYRYGRPRYRIARTFEGLNEYMVRQVSLFWERVGRAAGTIYYKYTDPKTGDSKSVPCTIIEDPTGVRAMRDIRDITIVFEQETHPDNASDPNGT